MRYKSRMQPLNLSDGLTGTGTHKEIWAVGSGKGGTGKSFLTSSLAISLAKLGKNVVLVDADLGCANLHTYLGMGAISETLSDYITGRETNLEKVVVDTPIANLRLISGAHDILEMANPTHARKSALLRAFAELDFDYLLLDLGAGTAYNTLDFFLAADKGILMVTPEPAAIENAYRFIKSTYFRYMKMVAKKYQIRQLVEQAMDLKNALGVHTVHDMVERICEADAEVGEVLRTGLQKLRPRLVVNQVRSVDDLTLGFSMRSSVEKYFGIRMDYSGYVEYDDTVWKSARERKPAVSAYPYASPARCVDRLMHNLLNDEQLELDWLQSNQ